MTMRLPAALVAYRGAVTILSPLLPLLLRRRVGRGKEEAARLGERYGRATRPRPAGDLVWAHGASIGETLSLLPVVAALVARGHAVLVTSGTRTSADILAARLPPGAVHQYLPADVPRFVARFLDHWRPGLALFAESEIWPTSVTELARRRIPLVLVNARMSARSLARWRRMPGIARALFGRLVLCVAQSAADAERFAVLGAPATSVSGNLKFDLAPPPAEPAALESLCADLAGRPVWLAASTHPGEDAPVLAAHRANAARHPGLLTILAPRHPERGPEILTLAEELGLAATRRAAGGRPDRACAVHVADTIGELGLFFRAVPLVFMGGSLVPHGGQNPIEPARLGTAILHGPHVANFAAIYTAFDQGGGAREIADGAALARAVGDVLDTPDHGRAMAAAAAETAAAFSGALERTMAALAPHLPARADVA